MLPEKKIYIKKIQVKRMGSVCATIQLQEEDIAQIQKDTGCKNFDFCLIFYENYFHCFY